MNRTFPPRSARLVPTLIAAFICALGTSLPAHAEKADKEKPTNIEANRMTSDDARRVSIFEGNVVLTKGTLTLKADRIVVRQDEKGFQHATATGNPVRFRQKTDPKGDKPAVWMEGEALRIEFDDANERVDLYDKAWVQRDQDEVRGSHISLDQRTEAFAVDGGRGGADGGRVRAIIQPKVNPGAPQDAAPTAPAAKPEAPRPAPARPAAGKQ